MNKDISKKIKQLKHRPIGFAELVDGLKIIPKPYVTPKIVYVESPYIGAMNVQLAILGLRPIGQKDPLMI